MYNKKYDCWNSFLDVTTVILSVMHGFIMDLAQNILLWDLYSLTAFSTSLPAFSPSLHAFSYSFALQKNFQMRSTPHRIQSGIQYYTAEQS